ncbi:dTDP-4-dehydrorhamnose 3,5-epimerase family protein [soil metagenome]
MDQHLSEHDIDDEIVSKLYTQSYGAKDKIEGVMLIALKNFVGEDGDLSEVLKFTESGEVENLPGFKVAQINRTQLSSGSIKGWHLHFRQNDVWHVLPSSTLLVGLWDVRKASPSYGKKMRLALGGRASHLLFIPKGVAHGAANNSQKDAEMLYFVDQKFDLQNPDEKRMPWDSLGKDFWQPQRD